MTKRKMIINQNKRLGILLAAIGASTLGIILLFLIVAISIGVLSIGVLLETPLIEIAFCGLVTIFGAMSGAIALDLGIILIENGKVG